MSFGQACFSNTIASKFGVLFCTGWEKKCGGRTYHPSFQTLRGNFKKLRWFEDVGVCSLEALPLTPLLHFETGLFVILVQENSTKELDMAGCCYLLMDNSSSFVMPAFYRKEVFWATHSLQILTQIRSVKMTLHA